MTKKNIEKATSYSFLGEGYFMLFHFTRKFVEKNGFLSDPLKGKFNGGFGMILYADYKQSDVGSYRALIFIPGQFKIGEKEFYSMTKVFVSSKEALEVGKNNWGITKELADFDVEDIDENTQKISVSKNSDEIVSFTFKSYNPTFPLSTKFIPNTYFSQIVDNKIYNNEFTGRGKAKFASLKDFSVNPSLFIDTTTIKHWATVRVDNFKLEFLESIMEEMNEL